ncbi:amino acid synthesis family protein [Rothia uropygialis]|uniref:amino acid synthesis family protein n=1 Tax=Kocuria sp. 36 TaxID=1415402 RepID=UPI00101CF92E|nr:amino acid synthesis family protein [Kocuria sp. 36]
MAVNTAPIAVGGEIATRIGLRSLTTVCDELRLEVGIPLQRPLSQAAAIAVVKNPWLEQGTPNDLGAAAEFIAPVLGKILTDQLISSLGDVENVEAFGKAALVGIGGELEHAGALIHTPYFGNIVRELLEGTSVLCFTDGRSAPGSDLRVPLWHKTRATSRDHYQTMEVHLPDAPRADEICVIAAAANGPRPFPRLGDRQTDRPITAEILKGILP